MKKVLIILFLIVPGVVFAKPQTKQKTIKKEDITFIGKACHKHATLGKKLMKCEAYRCGEHSVRKLKNGKCEYVQRFKIKTEYGVINKSLNCVLDRKYRKAIAQEIMDNASYFNRLTTNNLYKDYKKGLLSKNNSLKPKRDYRIGSVKTKAPIQYATDKEVCLPKFLQ